MTSNYTNIKKGLEQKKDIQHILNNDNFPDKF